MSYIISIHSFRGGTGKSNTTANLSALLAKQGLRVGVVDTDIQSPGVHLLFRLTEDRVTKTLNGFLYGQYPIAEAAYDVTHNLGVAVSGRVFMVPCSMKPSDISKVIREGYNPAKLNDGFEDLIDDLELDALIVDTHPGLNDETLLSIAISDALIIILRPDQQDYQGTHVTVQVARKLNVPVLKLVVNKTPLTLDPGQVKEQVEQTYGCQVVAVLPHSDEMMALASSGIFSLYHPEHAIAQQYRRIAETIIED